MKYKRLMLLLCTFIIFTIYIVHPYIIEKNRTIDGFNKDIIRFHVRANSDTGEDQALKLEVRDEILDVMGEKFRNTKSLEESREIIIANMDEMKSIAKDVVDRWGKDYGIDVSLGQDYFPIRKYGNMVFPQGEYETLMIEIGEGKGQNWWCVMFPPLCFIDITHSVAFENEELEEFIIDETQPVKLKSIILDLIKKIIGKKGE
ncbi:stage II sporulation protein R [Tissierellaceae bacterium HCP3S3_D8]